LGHSYYRRSAGGEEVDFVIEQHTRLLPIEVKTSRHLRTAAVRAVDAFTLSREAQGTTASVTRWPI
jgi:predicted AAA+ superfamily ATPase